MDTRVGMLVLGGPILDRLPDAAGTMRKPSFSMLASLSLAGLVAVVSVACDRKDSGGDESNRPRADQSWEGTTESGELKVAVTPEPNPIPFQELFALDVEVASADGDGSVENVQLDQVRGRMPAHDHGMKTSPKIEKEGAGEFRVRGMKFHMRGDGEDGRWVVEMVLQQDGRVDRAEFDVQCCRE